MEVKFKSRLQRRMPGAVRISSSILTVANGGFEYEADQRDAEILMKDMGVDGGSRGVTTAGNNGEGGQDVKGDKSESKFRAVAARGNYLGQDRMDVQYEAKEISKPQEQDWRAAKRLARHLKDHRRVVLE